MSTTTASQADKWLRPKNLLFAFVAVMIAYVLYHNEIFLIDASHPAWGHIASFKWWLLPHGLVGACALLLVPLQFSDRLRARHAKLYAGHCPCCGGVTVAPVPVGLEAGSPFSVNILSLALYLRFTHAISYQRLTRLFLHLFALRISEGALDAMFQRARPCFDSEVAGILARLRRSRIVCSDETSVRIAGRTHWDWVFQNDQVVIHVIRDSRAASVVAEVMAGHRPTIWVSDLYGAQQGHADLWQVCLAHQLRHRVVGRIYVAGALILAPLGAYIQFLEEPLGASRSFTMAAVIDAMLLVTTTGFGLFFAVRRMIPQHRQWMTRSYAVSLTFLEIRFILGVFGLDAPPSFATTEIVVWACVAMSVLLGDVANQWYELRLARPRTVRAVARVAA